MANKKPVGEQIQAVPVTFPYVQESFDLPRMDAFVRGLGTTFTHWAASPSPIGLNDKGDYRRNETDVITSNGYVYAAMGTFTAVMTGNQKDQTRPSEGALLDSSQANLVLPRFYDHDHGTSPCTCPPEEKRIYLTPGDRLYHSDSQADDLVVNKELLNFSFNTDNVPMYPIRRMLLPIMDSTGAQYSQGKDFIITENGNIRWIEGASNPGVDPDTGEGRTYSIRYLYRAFYYVSSIIREVRITDVTEGTVRKSERMPYFVQIQREYLYHNINRGDETHPAPQKGAENRQTIETPDTIPIKTGIVRVETTDIANDE